ncbi:MAG TPA: hypothetical protein VJM50_17975, partial [Pyrinomonadaceae bacterium]|nr:hypothetical protein [Pyrinomonadaceae bacterium]
MFDRISGFFKIILVNPEILSNVFLAVRDEHIQSETSPVTCDTRWDTFSPHLRKEKTNLSASSLILPRG